MNIAVIPARGGSKRIPAKNIRPFAGKPIIAYSIEAALESSLFDRIVVSTDSDAIAEVAQQFGAETPFIRPAELSDDFTGTNAVVAHAIQALSNDHATIEQVCCLYATAPFLTAEFIRSGFHYLKEQPELQFAFSATEFNFPIQRGFYLRDQRVTPIYPEHRQTRSQDLEPAYHDAGQFYWGRAQAFIDALPIFAPHSRAVLLPHYRVQDIDTLDDWRRAELMYQALTLFNEEPKK